MIHPANTSLTHRRQKFVARYVETGNARASAREAGYAERSAHVTGSRLLRNDKVAAAIEVERETLRVRASLDQDMILSELLSLYRDARNDGAYSAAARCLQLVAKMTGLDQPEEPESQAEKVLKLLAERLPAPAPAKSLGDGS